MDKNNRDLDGNSRSSSGMYWTIGIIAIIIIALIIWAIVANNNANGSYAQNTQATSTAYATQEAAITNGATVSSVQIPLLADAEAPQYNKYPLAGCDRVVMSARAVATTTLPLTAAFTALFKDNTKWPPTQEDTAGNYLEGQPGLTFQHVTLENGVADVLLQGQATTSGECDDDRLTTVITATAEQFPSVKTVNIYLNGVPYVAPTVK